MWGVKLYPLSLLVSLLNSKHTVGVIDAVMVFPDWVYVIDDVVFPNYDVKGSVLLDGHLALGGLVADSG